MLTTDAAPKCSAWAREVDLSPIASIGSYQGYLLLETPLPWPRDVSEMASLGSIPGKTAEVRYRLQALVPSSLEAAPEQRRMILYAGARAGRFAGYSRFETVVGGSLEEAMDSLLAQAAIGKETDSTVTDLLVCTHGRRDVCCGSRGTDLALQLSAQGPPAGVTFWRTSHTGGHRFAPTFIVLPQGTGWAFADPVLVSQVLERSVPFSEVAGHYRGCAGLDSPHGQALERDVLTQVGWDLLDTPRSAYPTGEKTADGGVVTRLDATTGNWEGIVRPGRTLPVPDCMKPLSEAKKTETEWTVSDVRAVS